MTFVQSVLVRMQRRPWRTCFAGGVLLALAAAWRPPGGVHADVHFNVTRAALVSVGVAWLTHVGRGSRGVFDRLAPLIAACLASFPFFLGWWDAAVDHFPHGALDGRLIRELRPQALLVTAVVVWAPVATGVVWEATPFRSTSDSAHACRIAAVFGLGAATAWLPHAGPFAEVSLLCWIAACSAAFHAAVRSRLPAALVLATAGVFAAIDLASSAGGTFERARWTHVAESEITIAQTARVLAWLAGGVLVLVARGARGQTAIPADHAVFDVAAPPAAHSASAAYSSIRSVRRRS